MQDDMLPIKDENEDKDLPCTPVKRSHMSINVGSRGSDHATGGEDGNVRSFACMQFHQSFTNQPRSGSEEIGYER